MQQTAPRAPAAHPGIRAALGDFRRAFRSIAVFSAAVNLLMLAGPLYMLQIYDRVLASRSVPTLVALSIMLVGAFAFQGALDLIRSRIVSRGSLLLDRRLGTTVHAAVVRLGLLSQSPGAAQQPMRDLDQVRGFMTSNGPIAIVDLPWAPIFLAICFLIHFWLGVTALVGGVLLFALAVLTERVSRAPAREIAKHAGLRAGLIEADRRNAETIVAMDMGKDLAARWSKANGEYLEAVRGSTDIVGSFAGLSRVIRLLLQSAMLGVGAYFVIHQELSAGAMIAASIMMGRALAPIETVISNWRGFIAARDGLSRLTAVLSQFDEPDAATDLPPPQRSLEVQNLTLMAPSTDAVIIKDVSFKLVAGEALGIIGPSGAGKSSLVRGLVGVWPAARGAVLLDDAALNQWSRQSLAYSVGFVGQSVELFDGTIAENIARMSPTLDSDAVLAAAERAGAHEMILRFKDGYDTRIGEAGANLSAGQRQRIALARALYRDPFLIVLDEPNANLDNDGDIALQKAVEGAKARGAIVIIIAHRPTALTACDKILVLANGTQKAFGPRDEVFGKLFPQRGPMRVVRTAEAAP